MPMKETKNLIVATMLGLMITLGGWVMSIHSRTAVLEEKAIRNDKDRTELKTVIRENTRAINDLKEYLIRKGE